ncbi:phospholipase A2 group XV-like [Ylistrum balloti]|uniref:phospholipase A2 group XV-like n=1 Tax=Ylistrum balloti TaxID=509963 RepID=UPI002905D9FD|nr:phospholipase A2 group XV-like [Ylistrum balloti]
MSGKDLLVGLFLLLCIQSSLEKPYHGKPLSPVILMPGDGGSQFYAKLNKTSVPHVFCEKVTPEYFNLWLDVYELAPYFIDCFTDNMRLVYDPKTRTTHNAPGVDIQIRGWGDTETVEWLDPSHFGFTSYFYYIALYLESWGYKRGVSIRGAPYDFRKAPNELGGMYKKLQALIEETYTMNNNASVTLLGHSMGNPVTLYFLNHMPQAWKDKYIKSFVSLAGVWTGVIKTLRLFTSGDNLNVYVVDALKVRPEQRSMVSTAWLLPSDRYWTADEILVTRPERNYTVKDFKQFFQDLNFTDGYDMHLDTKELIRDLTPPGVEVHCLHGHNISTPGRLEFGPNMWPDSQPKVIPDDGDGTVNIRSLHACTEWKGKQKQNVYHKQFDGAEHMEILKDPRIKDYLKSLLIS